MPCSYTNYFRPQTPISWIISCWKLIWEGERNTSQVKLFPIFWGKCRNNVKVQFPNSSLDTTDPGLSRASEQTRLLLLIVTSTPSSCVYLSHLFLKGRVELSQACPCPIGQMEQCLVIIMKEQFERQMLVIWEVCQTTAHKRPTSTKYNEKFTLVAQSTIAVFYML